ncbi:MAG TPA: hypothetical protein VLB50_02395 [Ignavibacteriaceae bacterium]|nr:hypothetical protein [Ignavibacteriaceae bacterium]
MKNVTTCPNCGTENPLYKLNCLNCKTYLRERIYNLDLWKVIGLLIESPVKAYRLIIQSEHKNFIFLILALFSIKSFINARFLSLVYSGSSTLKFNFELELLTALGAGIIVILIYAVIFSSVNLVAGLKTRLKDNYAVFSYSLLPYTVGLAILFPIEIIIFGEYLFSDNPSPFIIKPSLAYFLLSIEGLLILWGLYLTITGIFAVSKNILYSVFSGLIFYLYLYGFLFFLSKILFN